MDKKDFIKASENLSAEEKLFYCFQGAATFYEREGSFEIFLMGFWMAAVNVMNLNPAMKEAFEKFSRKLKDRIYEQGGFDLGIAVKVLHSIFENKVRDRMTEFLETPFLENTRERLLSSILREVENESKD